MTDVNGSFDPLYLVPGEYVLSERKAPKGYQMIEDITITVEYPEDEEEEIEIVVEDPKLPDKPEKPDEPDTPDKPDKPTYNIPFTGIGG